jgi:hypothetical protein
MLTINGLVGFGSPQRARIGDESRPNTKYRGLITLSKPPKASCLTRMERC